MAGTMMRGLIVEDERQTRTMLRRIIEGLGVEAHESGSGLELLQMLEDESLDADFLILNTNMKELDGIETLRAIRSSETYRDLPVVCITDVGSPAVIHELVEIGVSQILLKPIRPEFATPRLREVIKKAGRWRQHSQAGRMKELLLVDADPNFLAFARPILEKLCRVTETTSGIKAAGLFQSSVPRPGIIVVSDNLKLMSESRLVEAVRRLSVQLEIRAPEIYLLSSTERVDPQMAARFQGVLQKSFVPEQFSSSFQRVVLRVSSPSERLGRLLEGELQPELLSATQQAIGVLMGQDVVRLDSEAIPGLNLPIRSTIIIGGPESGVALELSLLSDVPSVISLSAKMLGSEISIEEGAAEALNELANTIAGRLRASLLTRGLDLKMGLPKNVIDEPAKSSSEWSLPAGFRSGPSDLLMLGIRVEKC